MKFTRIELRTNEYAQSGEVDQIVLVGYDIHFHADICGDERRVKLAKRMADDLGIELNDLRKI